MWGLWSGVGTVQRESLGGRPDVLVLIPRTEVFAGLKWLHSCLCEPVIGGERADNIHQPEDGEGQTGEGASLIKIGDVFVLTSFRLSDVISDYFACFFS